MTRSAIKFFVFLKTMLCFLLLSAQAQAQLFSINENDFQILTETIDDAGSNVHQLVVTKNGERLHTHNLYKLEGDCSDILLELGKYKIEKDKIIFLRS